MNRGFRAFLAFAGGGVAGWLMTLGLYIVLTSTGLLFDREGAMAMAFAFFIGPVVGLICGVAAAAWAARRSAAQ